MVIIIVPPVVMMLFIIVVMMGPVTGIARYACQYGQDG